MANKLRDDDLQLNIIVNGDKGKKELGDLEKSTRELTNRNKELRVEKEKLIRAGKQETEQYKQLELEIRENNKAIKTNELRMAELRKEMGLTGLTMKQLRSEQVRLKRLLDSTTPHTEQWKLYRAELAKVDAQIAKVSAGSRTMSMSIGKLADGFTRYFSMATAGIAIATGVAFSLAQWTKGLVDLDDQLADVMKTTGLTRREVREMYTDFRYLNTRTPRTELLLLAEEAGRLGKTGKKDIQDFVEVANKIKVALGDDLGGEADVALREVGKLTEIFKVGEQYGTDFKTSMEKIGSGINTVANNSNASAGYLIEYMKRLGGVSVQARIGSADIMGYAATLDQLGQNVEMSATAQSKLIVDMFTDPAKYARIAKMEVSEFSKLLKSDANEAFIKFLEGLNGNNEGLSVMATKLDGLGIDGARAVQVLAALSSNTKMVRDQQALANKAMDEGTSLTNEYNIKNNNLAGSLAKIGQYIRSQFVNSGLITFLEKAIAKTAELINQPMAKMLQEEQKQVNRLVAELTTLNVPLDRRREIMKQLNDISPDIVEGLKAESIATDTLRKNLEAYNAEMVNKIILANLEDEEQKQAARAASEKERLLNAQTSAYQKLGEINTEIATSELSLLDKIKKAREFLYTQLGGKVVNYRGDFQGTDTRSKELKDYDDLGALLEIINTSQRKLNEAVSDQSGFTERAKIMRELLGLNTALTGGGGNGGNGGNGGDGGGGGNGSGGASNSTTDFSDLLKPAEEDDSFYTHVYAQARKEAELLAEKKASEEEWTQWLKKQIDERAAAEAKAFGIEKEIADARIALKDIQVEAISQLAGTLAGMFEQGSAAQIAMIAVEKAIAIAQIWMNLAKEKSAINLAAAQMSTIPGVGIGLAAAYSATMTAKALVAAKINTGLVVAQTVASAVSSKKREKKQAYAAGKYPLETGMYGDKPHMALFNEVPGFPEMVIDGYTTRKLKLNYPEILKAIYTVRDGKTNGYAQGKYSPPSQGGVAEGRGGSGLDPTTANRLISALEAFEKKQLVVYTRLIKKDLETLDKIDKTSGL